MQPAINCVPNHQAL